MGASPEPPLLPPVAGHALGYSGPTTPRDRGHWLAMACVWGVGVLAWNVVILAVMPRVERTFRDFEVSLPEATKVCLSIARFMGRDYGAVVMVPLTVAAAVGVVTACQLLSMRAYRWAVFLSVMFWAGMLLLVAAGGGDATHGPDRCGWGLEEVSTPTHSGSSPAPASGGRSHAGPCGGLPRSSR